VHKLSSQKNYGIYRIFLQKPDLDEEVVAKLQLYYELYSL